MQKKSFKKPIIVNVKNSRKYQDIITLVDRDDFRTLFERAIKFLPNCKITTQTNWRAESLKTEVSQDSIQTIIKFIKKLLPKNGNHKTYLFQKAITIKQTLQLETKIHLENSLYFYSYVVADLLSQKFNKLGDYFELIHALLVKKQVNENDYSLVKIKVFDPNHSLPLQLGHVTNASGFYDFFSLPTKQKIAIYVSPGSRIKDIIDEIEAQNSKSDVNIIQDITSQMKLESKFFDLKQNIKRDRKWYWMNKQGSSYRNISKLEAQKYGGEGLDYYENVKAAVQAYKKLLAVEI